MTVFRQPVFPLVRMRVLPLLLLIVAVSAALPCAVYGQEPKARRAELPNLRIGNEFYMPLDGFQVGPFRMHPFLSQRFASDSNIYLVEKDSPQTPKWSDSLLVTEAGARFDLAYSKQKMLIGYRMLNNKYTRRDENDNVEHVADLLADFRLGTVFIKMQNNYAYLYEPTPALFDTTAKREQNRGSFGLGLKSNKLYLEAAYGMSSYHFEGRDYDSANNKQNMTTGILGFKLSPRTRMSLRYDTGAVDYAYDIQNDYTRTTTSLGVHYRVTDKLQSFIYVGSTSQKLDSVRNNAQTKEFSGVTTSGSLAYKLSPKTQINLELLRDIQYNAYVNYMLVTRLNGRLFYQWTRKVRLGLRVGSESSKPSEKIGSAASSTKIAYGLSARYDFSRSFALGLDYQYMSKSSKQDYLSYTNNTFFLHLTFHF